MLVNQVPKHMQCHKNGQIQDEVQSKTTNVNFSFFKMSEDKRNT